MQLRERMKTFRRPGFCGLFCVLAALCSAPTHSFGQNAWPGNKPRPIELKQPKFLPNFDPKTDVASGTTQLTLQMRYRWAKWVDSPRRQTSADLIQRLRWQFVVERQSLLQSGPRTKTPVPVRDVKFSDLTLTYDYGNQKLFNTIIRPELPLEPFSLYTITANLLYSDGTSLYRLSSSSRPGRLTFHTESRPQPIWPAGGENPPPLVEFEWKPIIGALHYEVQVQDQSRTSWDKIYTQKYDGDRFPSPPNPGAHNYISVALNQVTKYQWRFRAFTSTDQTRPLPWSPWWSFTTAKVPETGFSPPAQSRNLIEGDHVFCWSQNAPDPNGRAISYKITYGIFHKELTCDPCSVERRLSKDVTLTQGAWIWQVHTVDKNGTIHSGPILQCIMVNPYGRRDIPCP